MRFGRTLDKDLVPEWKGQYLDYVQGKGIIKKISKEKQSLGDRIKQLATPRTARSDPVGTSSSLETDLQLPSPAIHVAYPTNTNQTIVGSEEILPPVAAAGIRNAPPNENSPLASQPVARYDGSSDPNTPQMIPLKTIEKDKANEFFTWLDKEIEKVEIFYNEQEDSARTKLAVLEEQIKILQDHEIHHKKKAKLTTHVPTRAAVFFSRIGWPSLPRCFKSQAPSDERGWSPNDGIAPNRRTKDFEKSSHTFLQARRMLKVAIVEYYQYLQNLKGFAALNETAVRKIVKKFDKTFSTKYLAKYEESITPKRFVSSHELSDLTLKTENLFATEYHDGNHKNAVQTLQANHDRDTHNSEVLITGLALGGGLVLFIRAIVKAVELLHTEHEVEVRYLLQIWSGFLFIALILLLFSLNVLGWHAYRVNYPFIFELHRTSALDYRQYAVAPALMFLFLSLFAWLTFDVGSSHLAGRYFPTIFLGVCCVVLVAPVDIFYRKTRRWLVIALVRLFMSGLYNVEFRDFFLGDIFCSLTYSLSNVEFFFCVYSISQWWVPGTDPAAVCSSSRSKLMGFFQCLPGIWRFLQCWRRYGDTYDWFPHLLNAGKYSCLIIYYMFLSLARIDRESTKYKALLITFAIINSVYSALWDIFMDFSLGPNLRPILVYPKWWYYSIMVVDPILRFQWVLYIVYWDQVEQSALISFIVALIEVIRRFLWIFFRVENEHATNILMYRAFKDFELPYATKTSAALERKPASIRSSSSSVDTTRVESDGEASFGLRRRQTTAGSWTPAGLDQMRWILNRAHATDFTRREEADVDEDEEDE